MPAIGLFSQLTSLTTATVSAKSVRHAIGTLYKIIVLKTALKNTLAGGGAGLIDGIERRRSA